MKLKPIGALPSVKLSLRVSGELHADLAAYAAYYRETTGQPIEVRPLVMQMLEQFVDTDRTFQEWRRRARSGLATARPVVAALPATPRPVAPPRDQ
jgi:hypothetical protein